MVAKIKKWPQRKNYYDRLIDITSQPYPELTNEEVLKEIEGLLKNNWISRRVESKLRDLMADMRSDRLFCIKKNI